MTWRPWDQAWSDALYGERGFYSRPEGPAGHFRTAAHASGALLGRALADLAALAGCRTVVDVGAGRGELLTTIGMADPELALTGVETTGRPGALPARIAWSSAAPPRLTDTLLVGWELLDVVPCPVLEVDSGGALRQVLVDATGRERLGEPAADADLEWSRTWWPTAEPGDRVEVGRTRDTVWADLVGRLDSGLALAVDYGHDRSTRPSGGSLTGFRAGRQVRPAPDGSTDVTASVALDSLAAACSAVPGRSRATARCAQHEALRALGVSARRPDAALATTDAGDYLRALRSAGEGAELLDPGGLGGFGWVLHAVGDRGGTALARLTAEAADSTSGAPS